MNRQQRRAAAKKLVELEKRSNENNISEIESEIESLIQGATLEDLFEIDEFIMKKYLTN